MSGTQSIDDRTGLAPVQDLPVLAPLPPRPRIKKISLEEAFAYTPGMPAVDDDGNPDWD